MLYNDFGDIFDAYCVFPNIHALFRTVLIYMHYLGLLNGKLYVHVYVLSVTSWDY